MTDSLKVMKKLLRDMTVSKFSFPISPWKVELITIIRRSKRRA